MAIRQLSDANPDGTVLGQSSTDKIGFYGATPVAKQTLSVTITSASASSTIADAVNEIKDLLETLGLATVS